MSEQVDLEKARVSTLREQLAGLGKLFPYQRQRGRPQGQKTRNAKPRGAKPGPNGQGKGPQKGKGGKPQAKGPRSFEAKPAKKDRIDPDNPFAAALMGLKDKG